MVSLDSNIFIYILEKNSEFYETSFRLVASAIQAGEQIAVSTLVLAEIIGASLRKEAASFFEADSFVMYDVSRAIAIQAGELRYHHPRLRPADAVHLATALAAQCGQFITNDQRLVGLRSVEGLKIQPLA